MALFTIRRKKRGMLLLPLLNLLLNFDLGLATKTQIATEKHLQTSLLQLALLPQNLSSQTLQSQKNSRFEGLARQLEEQEDEFVEETQNTTTPFVTRIPPWLEELQSQEVEVGNSLIYDFGDPYNIYGEGMTVKIRYGGASHFSDFDPILNTFYVSGLKLASHFVGVYKIRVTAQHEMVNGQWESYQQEFTLKVIPKQVVTIEPEEKVEPLKPSNLDGLPVWGANPILEAFLPEPFSDNKPIPYIAALSLNGLLTIGWDNWMSVPPNYKNLAENTKIASRTPHPMEPSKAIMFWDEQKLESQELHMVDSLIVTMVQVSDVEEFLVEIAWNMVSFDRDFVKIQLQIPQPDSVSMFGDVASLRVSFWAASVFQSEKGKAVRLGTTLHWQIYRQVSQSVYEDVMKYQPYVIAMIIIIAVFLITWIFSKKTIAFWIYFNSLMLVAYLPMLDIFMPSNVLLLMMPFMNMVRFKYPGLVVHLNDSQDENRSQSLSGDHNIYSQDNKSSLQPFGYGAFFTSNAPLILMFLLIVCFFWGLTAIKDSRRIPNEYRQKLPTMMQFCHEIPICNFILRFSYETFLEIALCVFVSLQAGNMLTPFAIFQWLLAFAFLVAMAVFTAFLFYKLYRGGPNVPEYYGKLTVASLLCWQARPINTKFDHKGWLKKYKNVLRAKFTSDDNEYKIQMKAKSGKNKPQHKIRIKGNQCQPVNSIEEDFMTERHLLDTTESKTRGKGIGSVAIQIQDIEEEINITENNQHVNKIQIGPLNVQTAETSEEEENFVDMNDGPDRFSTIKKDQIKMDPRLIQIKDYSQKRGSMAHRIDQQNITADFYKQASKKENVKKFYEGGEQDIKTSQTAKISQYIPEAQIYLPPPKKNAGDPPGDTSVQKIWYRQKATIGINSEKTIPVPNRYKTLFLGLKLNHPKNATVVYPLCFLLRRILFALTIVQMRNQSSGLWCVLVTMAHTLFMLGYSWAERPWQDSAINTYHILNEGTLYTLCLFSVFFCSVESSIQSRLTIGWVFISIFAIQMLGNTLFLFKIMGKHIRLVLKIRYALMRRERTAGQVLDMMKLINMQLFNDPINQSMEEPKKSPTNSESPVKLLNQSKEEQKRALNNITAPRRCGTSGLLSLSDIKYQMKPKRTAYGGLQGTFIFSEKQLSFDHISSIFELEQSKQLTPMHVTDMSLFELHKEFQGYTFDNALQDHIRKFISGKSPRIGVDLLDSMSVSQLSPEPRHFEASILQSSELFSIEGGTEDKDHVPTFLRDQQTYLQAQQQKQRRRTSEHKRNRLNFANSKLKIVPEQTVEESRFMSPNQQTESLFRAKEGQNVWALQFFKPAYSGPEAVIKLKQEQEKLAAQKSAPPIIPSVESSETKGILTATPFDSEKKMGNFQSGGTGKDQSLLQPTSSEQNTVNFLKEKSEVDISMQLRMLDHQASLPPEPSRSNPVESVKKVTTHSLNFRNTRQFDEESIQSTVMPAPPNKRKEASFSGVLEQSDAISLISRDRQHSMKSLSKLTKKQQQLSSFNSSGIANPQPAQHRKREPSISNMSQSESERFLQMIQRPRDLHRDRHSMKSLKKLTQKQKELRKPATSAMEADNMGGLARKREPSFSQKIDCSISNSNSRHSNAGGKQPPTILKQRFDDSSDEGKAQAFMIPPNRRKEASFSRESGSRMSMGSESLVNNTPIRQKSFIASPGSYIHSQKQHSDLSRISTVRDHLTLPNSMSASKTQVIGEKPQEEEETVARAKEEKKASDESKKRSDSPERHEHESNQRQDEESNQSKFINQQNIESFVNNESSIIDKSAISNSPQMSYVVTEHQPAYLRYNSGKLSQMHNIGTDTCKPHQSMHTNMYNEHSSYARQLSIDKKNSRTDHVLEYFRLQNKTHGQTYEDHSRKDPFDIRQNETLSENKYQSYDRRNNNDKADLNKSSTLEIQRHKTPIISKTISRQNRANSQELIREQKMKPQHRNALFKTNTINLNTYKDLQQVKMDIRRRRSSKLLNSGSQIMESQTSKSKDQYSDNQSGRTPSIFSEHKNQHFFDNKLESSIGGTSKASLSAKTIVNKWRKNYARNKNSAVVSAARERASDTFVEKQLRQAGQTKQQILQMKSTGQADAFKSFFNVKAEGDKNWQYQSNNKADEKINFFSDQALRPKNIGPQDSDLRSKMAFLMTGSYK